MSETVLNDFFLGGEGRQEGKIVYLQKETKPSGAHRNE